MESTETVLYSVTGSVAKITLNNPAKHNSLGERELLTLQHYFAQINKDKSIRVLILTGNGNKTFCAGAALKELSSGAISPNSFQDTTDQLAALRVPTICAANGSIYGGGGELALSCDFRIGVQGSHLRVPAAQIGLCYPINGINRYVEVLGISLAKRILMAAERFDANKLKDIGFLDYLIEPDKLETKSQAMADSIAGLAPLAVQSMKEILQLAVSGDIDADYALELSRICSGSNDLKEGFAAQREKRKPVFTGS